MQELRQKTRSCGPLPVPGSLLDLTSVDERNEIKTEQLRNEASLNCAPLRSRVHYVARRGLSRVEMNACSAPLTALSAHLEECRHFLLDRGRRFHRWQVVVDYARATSLAKLAPHDLRRTCAKLCRKSGGELEQIQLLLGHASIQTTERYLGTEQNLSVAVNDGLGLDME